MKQLLYILLLLPVIGNAQFGKKISELPKVDALTSADLVPVVQNGKNYSATVSKFANASVPDTVTGTHLFTGVVQLDTVQLTGNSVVLRPVSVSKDSLTGALGRGCASDCYWLLNGNSGTTAGTNFIGTTDSKKLYFKTKNTTAMVVDTNQNVGIGTNTPYGKFTVNDNAKNLVFGAQYSDLVGDTVWGTTMIDSCHKYGIVIQDPSSPNDHFTVLYSMDSCTGEGAQLFLNHDAYNQEMGIILNYDNPDTNKAARITFNSDGLRVLKNTDFSYLFQITPTGQMVYPKGAASGKILTSDASGNATWGNQILTGSATLDFGTIAPNSHETLTITVTGAALGDVVSLGIPNSSTDDHGAFMAWVSATNTVSVKCFNFDGVGFDPASGTFTAKIFK